MSELEPLDETDEVPSLDEGTPHVALCLRRTLHVQEQQHEHEQSSAPSRQLTPSKSMPGQQHHGRPISRDMLIRALEKQNVRIIPGMDTAKVLAKQTHLHLNAHRINQISSLQLMKGLEVLYLYDNMIQRMEGLASLQSLTHLYLQNNEISQIEGISGLSNLSKLYLQGNHIVHVSGLNNLPNLEELHLSSQQLLPGQGMTFDLHSMLSISPTLRVLCARACGLGDEAVAMLPPLPQLRKLDLADNYLQVVECLEVVVKSAGRLTQLEVHNNPFCRDQQQRYRDPIILLSDSLASLDGENITQQQRHFLLNLHIRKLKLQAAEVASEEAGSSRSCPRQQRMGAPHGGSVGVQRQVSGSRAGVAINMRRTPSIPNGQDPALSLGLEGMQIK